MRIFSSSLVLALVLSLVAAPTADAWIGSSLKASVTKFDVRASARAKRASAKKAARPASVEMPAIAKGGLLFGDAEATTTVVMFTDIECPFCKRFHEGSYVSLKKDYIDAKKVRFVIRHFPLSFHPNARNAAKAVVCARAQGDEKARSLYGKLIAQKKMSASSVATAAAAVADLDHDVLLDCMDDESTGTTVDADLAAGKEAKVSGTPTFLIIGPSGTQKTVLGAVPIETFAKAIEAVQASAK